MTTTIVEVEQTVKEEMTLCDECQREVDENGKEFTPDDSSGIELHYCSKCLDKVVDETVNPAYVEEAEEWLTKTWEVRDHEGFKHTKSVKKALKSVDDLSTLLTGIGLAFGIGLLVLSFAMPIPVWAIILYGVGGLLANVLLSTKIRHIRTASKKVERLMDEERNS